MVDYGEESNILRSVNKLGGDLVDALVIVCKGDLW